MIFLQPNSGGSASHSGPWSPTASLSPSQRERNRFSREECHMSETHETPDHLLLDALAVAQELDRWTRRPYSHKCPVAVLQGHESYADLLKRRELLHPISLVQATAIDTLLDGIRARLKFLSHSQDD